MPGIPKTVAIGHYAVSFGGNSLGIIEQPHRYRLEIDKIQITSDSYGPGTTLDNVFTGFQGFIAMALLEWTTAIRNLENIYGTAGTINTPGLLDTDFAKSLILTAQAGTKAATNHASRTAALAAPDGEISYDMGVAPRIVAVNFELIPDASSVLWTDG